MVGSYLKESLTNITGSLISATDYPNYHWTTSSTGAFTTNKTNTTHSISATNTAATDRVSNVYFNAYGSSSTYQNNTSVQQAALCLMVIIKY